jgi:hypothetical protein
MDDEGIKAYQQAIYDVRVSLDARVRTLFTFL